MGRLIITGAGGFLGCNVVKGVLEEGFFDEVIAITLGADQMKNRFQEGDRLKIFEADAISIGAVKLQESDVILNCAYPRAMKGADVTLGLDYVESVFQSAANAHVKGIMNISSQSVYDPQRKDPATEADIPVLTDEYAVGKYCMEMLLRDVCKDIPYTNIRLASLIGPGFDVRVPNKMVKNAFEKHVISVVKNDQHFGYLDIEDAVCGLTKLLRIEPKQWKKVYNLGGSRTYSLVEIAQCIISQMENKCDTNVSMDILDMKDGAARLNSSLVDRVLRDDIGDYIFNTLDESIQKIIDHYLDTHAKEA